MRCGEYSSTPARLPWGRRKTEGLEGWEAVRLGRFQPDPAGAGVPSPRHWERVRHQVSHVPGSWRLTGPGIFQQRGGRMSSACRAAIGVRPVPNAQVLVRLRLSAGRKEHSRWAHGPGAINGEQRPEAGAEFSESQEPTDEPRWGSKAGMQWVMRGRAWGSSADRPPRRITSSKFAQPQVPSQR